MATKQGRNLLCACTRLCLVMKELQVCEGHIDGLSPDNLRDTAKAKLLNIGQDILTLAEFLEEASRCTTT